VERVGVLNAMGERTPAPRRQMGGTRSAHWGVVRLCRQDQINVRAAPDDERHVNRQVANGGDGKVRVDHVFGIVDKSLPLVHFFGSASLRVMPIVV
jgi:hypothetical protein